MKKRLLSYVLIAAMLMTMLVSVTPVVSAEERKTKAISVVFDNSGSMYMSGSNDYSGKDDVPKAWCRATYAMEVFASMLNEGDVMQIHPMNPAYKDDTCTGTPYLFGENPLLINGPKDAGKIRDLYLKVVDGGAYTPLASIPAAYEALKKMNADEKYLVVLTDGATFYTDANTEMSESETLKTLTSTLGSIKDVQVMYLGMGPAQKPGGEDATHQYAVAADTAKVLHELTKMCNTIFGRDALPNVSGSVDIDVSMKKVIVFAQGKGASDVVMGGFQPVSQVKVEPSQRGIDPRGAGGSYESIPLGGVVDNNLGGVIATFENIPAGNHALNVGGEYNAIEVYYEPDVSLQLQFADQQGNPIDPQQCYAGTYTLSWYMIDNQTGERTDSALLGTPQYDIQLKLLDKNGNEKPVEPQGQSQVDLTLEAGDNLTGTFLVTYLNRYTSQSSMEDLGWGPNGLTITPRPVGEVKLSVTGGKDTYQLSTFEQEATYQVQYYCQGEPVTGADLDRAEEPKVAVEGGNAKVEIKKNGDGSGWTVSLKYNVDAVSTQCGEQKITFTGSYTNVDGETGQAVPVIKPYTLEDDSHGLRVELQLQEDYYVLYELDGAEPVTVKLTVEGMNLTADQFAATTVRVQIDGLQENTHYTVTPDPVNSSYIIRFTPDSGIEAQDYTIRAVAQGKDEVGRDITADASAEVSFNSIPLWLKILLWVLAILLVLLLIWLYLNAKVLPKRIVIERYNYRIGSKEVSGDVTCNFSGKKRGYLEITPPYFPAAPMASSCSAGFELVAVSPRRIKSSHRYIGIRAVIPGDEMSINRIKVGGLTMVKNADGEFVRMGTTHPEPVSEDVDSGVSVCIYGDVPGPRNRKVSVALDVRLQFE